MQRFAVIAIVAAAGVIGWLYWRQGRAVPLVVSGFVEADEVRVGSRVGGRIARVWVAEGQKTATGQPLFEIDPFDLREQCAEAQGRLAAYQAEHARLKAGYRAEEIEQARALRDAVNARLEKLVAGPRPQEIEIARQEVLIATANLELAESEHARLERLAKEVLTAQKEFDEAVRAMKSARGQAASAAMRLALLEEGTRKEELAEARAALLEAEALLKLRTEGYRAEEVAQAAAQVAAAQAQVAAIEVRLKELIVVSPCDCVVEAIDLRPGDLVGQNAPSVSLLDLSNLWVRAYVPEGRLSLVELGRRVPVRVDSLPNERLTGQISFIAREAEFTPRNVQTSEERSKQVFRIKVTLEEGVDRVQVGVAADVMLSEATSP